MSRVILLLFIGIVCREVAGSLNRIIALILAVPPGGMNCLPYFKIATD